jgi:hypothetical protein
MQSYKCGRYSPFLMQAILASAAQYAPSPLLAASGFSNRLEAQKSFASKATLLYDLGRERSQLRMLQGSLIMGTTSVFCFTKDKDFRYWLQNAARISVNMGLHKKDIADDVDLSVYKLCRRIWWLLYTWDVFLSITGWRNMRMLDCSDCDADPPTEDDWDEGPIPDQFSHVLTPTTKAQKLYLIENFKLAAIGDRCLVSLKFRPESESHLNVNDLARPFVLWRASLPELLRIQQYPEAARDNILPILLMATSYRIECVLYRAIRIGYQAKDEGRSSWAKQRLQVAMLELDTLIGKVMTYGLYESVTLNIVSCAITSLALRIDFVLSSSEPEASKVIAHVYIRQNMAFLMQLQHLPSVKSTVSMFEWVINQRGLGPVIAGLESPAKASNPDRGEVPGVPPTKDHSVDELALTIPTMFPTDIRSNTEAWFEELLSWEVPESLGGESGWCQ